MAMKTANKDKKPSAIEKTEKKTMADHPSYRERFSGLDLRDRHLFHAFRRAHVGHYMGIIAIRSPALIASFFVYAGCAQLFGIGIGLLEMVGFLPIIFASTFIPGPFRGAAVLLWVELFPGQDPGQMTAFGFVQHNFFLVFNAVLGLLFVRTANRELFGDAQPAGQAGAS